MLMVAWINDKWKCLYKKNIWLPPTDYILRLFQIYEPFCFLRRKERCISVLKVLTPKQHLEGGSVGCYLPFLSWGSYPLHKWSRIWSVFYVESMELQVDIFLDLHSKGLLYTIHSIAKSNVLLNFRPLKFVESLNWNFAFWIRKFAIITDFGQNWKVKKEKSWRVKNYAIDY